MKAFSFLLLILLSPAVVEAQHANQDKKKYQERFDAYGAVWKGYDFSVFNEIVKQYNASRDLDEEMDMFSDFIGFSYQDVYFWKKKVWVGYHLDFISQERTALFNVYGKLYRQNVKLEDYSVDIQGGLYFPLGKKARLLLGAGLGGGYFISRDRSYGVADGRPEWNFNKQIMLHAGPVLSLSLGKPWGFVLEPYYSYGFFPLKTQDLLQALVPNAGDSPRFSLNHYGLRVFINFYEDESNWMKKVGKRL